MPLIGVQIVATTETVVKKVLRRNKDPQSPAVGSYRTVEKIWFFVATKLYMACA